MEGQAVISSFLFHNFLCTKSIFPSSFPFHTTSLSSPSIFICHSCLIAYPFYSIFSHSRWSSTFFGNIVFLLNSLISLSYTAWFTCLHLLSLPQFPPLSSFFLSHFFVFTPHCPPFLLSCFPSVFLFCYLLSQCFCLSFLLVSGEKEP